MVRCRVLGNLNYGRTSCSKVAGVAPELEKRAHHFVNHLHTENGPGVITLWVWDCSYWLAVEVLQGC